MPNNREPSCPSFYPLVLGILCLLGMCACGGVLLIAVASDAHEIAHAAACGIGYCAGAALLTAVVGVALILFVDECPDPEEEQG